MCPIVKEHGGDIDKFIGDAIMAVFEDLREREPPPFRAVRAALAMQAAMDTFNEGRAIKLSMRIGINTGTVVRGDLGSRVFRRDYTVIGDCVNQANRYEAKCPHGKVLVSASTREVLGAGTVATPMPGLTLKGVAEPVTGYVIESLAEESHE
jgi:adenylate cyclase